ncbi:MAG TPA: ROK family glucokinase [Candidatus Aquicultor sp.]
MNRLAIALDVGGTKIAAAVVDRDGRMRSSLQIDTPNVTTETVITAIKETIAKLIDVFKAEEIVGVGLAVAGTIDFARGIIVESPNLPFRNVSLHAIIESEFGLPTFMDNDGNLAALGELYYGSARGARDVVALTLGTGIGAGIIINGCLYRGETGSAAEIGHMVVQANGRRCSCGSCGCFEELASGRALVRIAKELAARHPENLVVKGAGGEIERITGPMVTEAAQHGDAVAMEAFKETGYWLGIGVNNIINIFNPQLVVLGGGMAEAGELVLEPVRRIVAECTLSPNKEVAQVVLADLGNQAGVLGAAALTFNELSLQ